MRALSVAIWFFFAASSVMGGLLMLYGLSQAQTGPGPGAPLEGVAILIGLVVLAVCFVAFILCLRFRPSREAFTGRSWAFAVTTYALFILSVCGFIHSTRYTLTARVIDSSGHPVPGASVRFKSFPLGQGLGRFDRLAEGSTITDAAGTATVRTNHAHRIDLEIQKEGFQRTTIEISAAGHRYRHQIIPPASSAGLTVELPRSARLDQHAGYLIPRDGDIALTVALKQH